MSEKPIKRNIAYTISTQFIALLISVSITLILPKIISVELYGYWQLYLFYSSYVGLAHLGWLDGIYLLYGGYNFEKLDKTLIKKHFLYLAILQVSFGVLISWYALAYIPNINKFLLLLGVSCVIVLANLYIYFGYLLQVTNQFNKFAQMNILYYSFYFLSLLSIAALGVNNIFYIICADLFGRLLGLLLGMYFCREILFSTNKTDQPTFRSIAISIKIGIPLMLANLASSFIVGAYRFEIERIWSVAIFGKISLSLSLSNFILVFLNAVGIVLFPLIRRTKVERLAPIYSSLRSILSGITLSSLFTYFILVPVITFWLPKYTLSLHYISYLFPMVLFEGRMALLINPYMKALRKEKALFFCNIIVLVISIGLAILFGTLAHNLNLMILGIIISLFIKSIVTEIALMHSLNISCLKDTCIELFCICFFIYAATQLNRIVGAVIYLLVVVSFIIYNKNNLIQAIKTIK